MAVVVSVSCSLSSTLYSEPEPVGDRACASTPLSLAGDRDSECILLGLWHLSVVVRNEMVRQARESDGS